MHSCFPHPEVHRWYFHFLLPPWVGTLPPKWTGKSIFLYHCFPDKYETGMSQFPWKKIMQNNVKIISHYPQIPTSWNGPVAFWRKLQIAGKLLQLSSKVGIVFYCGKCWLVRRSSKLEYSTLQSSERPARARRGTQGPWKHLEKEGKLGNVSLFVYFKTVERFKTQNESSGKCIAVLFWVTCASSISNSDKCTGFLFQNWYNSLPNVLFSAMAPNGDRFATFLWGHWLNERTLLSVVLFAHVRFASPMYLHKALLCISYIVHENVREMVRRSLECLHSGLLVLTDFYPPRAT